MNKQDNIYISIVIPAYNEGLNILPTLLDISAYLSKKDYSYEIIIVDDGSTDNTIVTAERVANEFPHFLILKNPANKGKGFALKKGMLAAKGKLVLFMDADNSTRIDQLDKLVSAINQGNDIAIASRRIPGAEIAGSQQAHRIILGNIYIILSKLILGTSVNDYNCGFKLYTQKAAEALFSRLTRNDWSFDSELIYLASKYRLKLKEVPVVWEDKSKTSKVKPIRDGIKSLFSLIAIKIRALKKAYD